MSIDTRQRKSDDLIQDVKKTSDFRLFLHEILLERCRLNPRYSLRSFARSLKIHPSALSAMLSGKRTITDRTRKQIGLALGLRPEDISRFKPPRAVAQDIPSAPDFQQVAVDTFAVISDWHHYAILELTKVRDFRPQASWIAKRLGITVSEVNIAIERLIRLGMLERDEQGGLRDLSPEFMSDLRDGLTTEAQRRFQQRTLQKAIEAIDAVAVTMRDNTSITMAIRKSDLPLAKDEIRSFRRKLCQTLSCPDPDEVYHLSVSLIPLTQVSTHLQSKGEKT